MYQRARRQHVWQRVPGGRDSAYRLVSTYAGFLWLQAAATLLIVGILRAGGDVRVALAIDVAPVWLVGVPLVFAFGPGRGGPSSTSIC